jgi:hypothetical protein
MSKLEGAIFPIPHYLTHGLFSGGPKIFVKYLPHNSTRLVKGNKIIFYESRGSKCLIGEGVVNSIEFLTPKEVIKNYKNLLFLSEEQFEDYVKLRTNHDPSKKMLTMKLTNIKKYATPIKYKNTITMAGKYIGINEFRSITE